MTTMEHLFMQIFDRKKWIEGQLRQQEESFSQSAAYNLIAAGLKPPAWLFDGGSEAPGCSEKEDFSKEQIISDILFRPGWVTTPSTNHHTLYSLPTFKNTSISHLNILSSQLCAQNEQVPSKNIGSNDTQPVVAASTNSDFEYSIQFDDPPATIQRSRSRQRDLKKRTTENEIALNIEGKNAVQPLEEYICHTEVPRTSEEAHLGSDIEHLELNVKNTAGLESQSPLIWSGTTHSSAGTLKSVRSNLSHLNNQGEAFERLVSSRIRDATANFHQEGSLNCVEKDNELAEVGFCTRSSSNTSKQNLFITSSVKNISLESSKVDIYQSSETSKEKQTRNAEKPDCPASQNAPLESGYFLRSSGGLRKSTTTPFEFNTRSSSITSKQNLSIPSSAKNKISMESRKVDICQSSERLEENQTYDAAKLDGPAFQNAPLESGYFLRSSGSLRKSTTTPFEFNTRSSSNTSKQNLSIPSSAKNKILMESRKVDICQSSERLEENQTCDAAKLDGPVFQNVPLESGYFLRSSGSHRKSTTPPFVFITRSSSNTSKQNLSIPSSEKNKTSLESRKVDICQSSERLEEKQTCDAAKPEGPAFQNAPLESVYFLRSSCSHRKSITPTFKLNTMSSSNTNKHNLSISSSAKNISLESGKVDIYQISDRLKEKQAWDKEKQDGPSSQIETLESSPFLRSSASHRKSITTPFKSNTGNLKRPLKVFAHTPEVSWPKRRKMTYHSNGLFASSPIVRRNRLMNTGEIKHPLTKMVSGSPSDDQIQPCPSQNRTRKGIEDVDTGSHFEVFQQNENPCLTEDYSYLQSAEHLESQAECTLGVPSCYLIDENVNACMQNMIEVDQSTLFQPQDCGISVDYHGPFYNYELGNIASGTFKHEKQFIEDSEMNEEVTDLFANKASKSPNHDDGQIACSDIAPEFEGFSIGFPSITEECRINSDCQNLVEGRVSCHEQMRSSMHLVTPRSGLSRYKINMLPDVFQSSNSKFSESMNLSNSFHFDGDPRQKLWRSQDAGYCNLDLDFLGSSNSYGMCSPGARSGREAKRPHLTPLVEKSNIKMISGRSVDSVGAVGSKPELVCFRIDENTCTSEENEFADELGYSEKSTTSSREIDMSVNRKALFDITSSYANAMNMAPITDKNMERSSLQSTDSKSFTGTQSITHFSLGTAYTSKQNQRADMENRHALTNDGNKDQQQSGQPLLKRSSKPKLSEKPVERNKGSAIIVKGCKPSNVVSNISSFIPLIPRKLQETPAKGKKDIKVKALGAAQAAKLLEEKKRNEREKRKEAAKLERLRLEEEKKLKQKQMEEEKQRKEADMAARKRLREEEDKKKERKRRCIKESQRMQRPQEERPDPEKGGKEMRHKHADEDKQKMVCEQETKHHFEKVNVTRIAEAARVELSTTKGIINLDNLKGVIRDRMSTTEENQDFQSYEMSPFRDSSDEEDEEDENVRARKHIPLWARKGHLEKALRSVQHLDPIEIFSQKDSFDMGEVLCLNVSRRPE